MSTQFAANNPTSYFGITPTTPGQNWYRKRDPRTTDYKGYTIGDRWINETSRTAWTLTANAAQIATWVQSSVVQATTITAGIVTLATNAETIAGTDTAKVVTPDDLKAKLGPQTAHGVLIGEGTSTAIASTTAGTLNQVLVSNGAASDPNWLTIPAFSAYKSAPTNDVTGSGTIYPIIFDAEIFDTNNNYDNTTGVFRASIAGNYQMNARFYLQGCTIAAAGVITLATPTFTYDNFVTRVASDQNLFLSISQVLFLNVNDICYVTAYAAGEAADTDDLGGDGVGRTAFSGHWIGP